MRFYSYLNSAKAILDEYDGSIPFATWLKQYFKSHKKFGSRDRKIVGDLCYSYFRLGKLFVEKSIEERLLTAQFLCHDDSEVVRQLKPEWSEQLAMPQLKKLNFLQTNAQLIFPFLEELSTEINKVEFAQSHLIQPDLFLRIRPGHRKIVVEKLQQASVPFTLEDDCVRIANASRIEGILEIDKEVVVQDKSSQKVLDPLLKFWQQSSFTNWDCCAASGGKTILLHDYYPKAKLTVSDIRESILHNLNNRFSRAGILAFTAFVADVASSQFKLDRKFDVIICDAPCSGSGTWGRTPEQLHFFAKEKIEYYAGLQKSIALNASKNVREGGCFLYITCSVFARENEEVVGHILDTTKLQLVKQQYFQGYTVKADTLFAALFTL